MLLILPWLLRSMCTVLLNNVALFWEYFWFDNSFIFLTDLHIKKEGKLINYLSTKWQQPSLDWEVYSKTKNSFFLVIEQFHHIEQTLSSSSLSLSLMVEEFLLSCSFQFTISNIFFVKMIFLYFSVLLITATFQLIIFYWRCPRQGYCVLDNPAKDLLSQFHSKHNKGEDGWMGRWYIYRLYIYIFIYRVFIKYCVFS